MNLSFFNCFVYFFLFLVQAIKYSKYLPEGAIQKNFSWAFSFFLSCDILFSTQKKKKNLKEKSDLGKIKKIWASRMQWVFWVFSYVWPICVPRGLKMMMKINKWIDEWLNERIFSIPFKFGFSLYLIQSMMML